MKVIENPLIYTSPYSKSNPSLAKVDKNTNNKNNSRVLLYSLAGLAILSTGTYYAAKKSVKTLPQVLKKQGLEIKDEIAIIKKTGEKFTGEIKRNTLPFGIEKERQIFKNGVIQERLISNINEKEAYGEFFINGELFCKFYHVIRGKQSLRYSSSLYNNSQQKNCYSFYSKNPKDSIVDSIRKHVQTTIKNRQNNLTEKFSELFQFLNFGNNN